MPSDRFQTVSSDLQALAAKAEQYFVKLGYSVKIEPGELGLPAAPALKCKRNQTNVFVIVGRSESLFSLKGWIAYCKSTSRDSQVCIVVPQSFAFDNATQVMLRQEGIGLLQDGPNDLSEIIPSRDLAMGIVLPDLSGCSKKGKRLLGPAYEKFSRGDWHACFDEACRALEGLARANLEKGLQTGRVTVMGARGPMVISKPTLRRATMGKLKDWYASFQNPSQIDVVLAKVLKAVVKDRNREIHRKHTAATENKLRKAVGLHMWTIVEAIRFAT